MLECCRVFKENGIETPVGANRWWLETFVFAQAYADLYNGGNTEAEIGAICGFCICRTPVSHNDRRFLCQKIRTFCFYRFKNVEVECTPALQPLNDRIMENVYVLGSNAGMKVEQWGNTCLIRIY